MVPKPKFYRKCPYEINPSLEVSLNDLFSGLHEFVVNIRRNAHFTRLPSTALCLGIIDLAKKLLTTSLWAAIATDKDGGLLFDSKD